MATGSPPPAAAAPLAPHPDRLLPSDPVQRPIARRLYESVRDLPLISPHGHVDPALLAADRPFSDPAALLVTPSPLNTVLWRVVAMQADGSYREGFYSLPDGGRPMRWRAPASRRR